MNFLGLAASPRKNGNTELLLDAFLESAAAAGARTQKVRLVQADIHPCIGCEMCFEAGQCQFDDDAAALYDRLLSADVVILATPVYFYSPSTYAKLLIDRCQTLWARRYILKQQTWAPGGRGVLISTGGSGGKSLFEGVRLTTKYFLDAFGKSLAACLTVAHVDRKRAIEKHPAALERARTLGRAFARDPNYKEEGCSHG